MIRLGQSVVQHVRHQNGRLAGAHTRQARIPGAAGAEVLLGCYGAGAARHTRVDRNRREVAKPSLAGDTTADENSARADEVSYRLPSGQSVDDYGSGRSCRGVGKGPVEKDAGSVRS